MLQMLLIMTVTGSLLMAAAIAALEWRALVGYWRRYAGPTRKIF